MVSVGVHEPVVGVGNGVTDGTGSGVGVIVGLGVCVGDGPPMQRAEIRIALDLADPLKMKSAGSAGFGMVNVAVTGSCVPI